MSGMTVGQASINARDLSRRAASVLDRVEHGERLVVTRDGEPIAEIIPIARAQRLLARWVRDGLIPEPPPAGYATATATAVASAAQGLPSVPAGRTATEVLREMREDER
ncbi:type II toxin-antitoxin system Phd/YefM family antitoxin [Frankia sp. CiP3]|uniref:type II toxin-antitoxin system Phd/YefM family antitoxin n=1 Tax=Frankia sp. CiP3 TaxID=2880971 RepID=UPI001EF7490A|nr:type II toxin-antitoxin system prevent-host-death family antitoxin [Frankia sp. CiP3]